MPVRAANASIPATRVEVSATPNDAVDAGLALLGVKSTPGLVRVVRQRLTPADSMGAQRRTISSYTGLPGASDADRAPRQTIDAIGGVTSATATLVARFPRVWVLQQGTAIARWADGEPAAVEHEVGGCIRDVSVLIDEASDVTLRVPFQRFVQGLLVPCGGARVTQRVSTAMVATVAGTLTCRRRGVARSRGSVVTVDVVAVGSRCVTPRCRIGASPLAVTEPRNVSIFSRLRAVRTVLVAGIVLRAVAWGVVTALTLVVGAAVIDLVVPLSLVTRDVLAVVAILSGIVVTAALCWRDRAALSLTRVALWIEEHFPSLEYTLVTAAGFLMTVYRRGRPLRPRWSNARPSRRTLAGRPLALVMAGVFIVLILPSERHVRRGWRSPERCSNWQARESADTAGRRGDAAAVQCGERSVAIDEPSDIRALTGSVLTLRGRGNGAGVVARIGADSIVATTRADRWSITLRLPSRPAALRLADGNYDRLIAIEPIADEPPAVILTTPVHDSVLRVAKGRIGLSADVSDDFGIASASFEYIVSSGEGETFKFRSGTLGAIQPEDKRTMILACSTCRRQPATSAPARPA